MPNRSRTKFNLKKAAIAAAVLAAIQAGAIFYFSRGTEDLSPKDAITKSIEKLKNIPPERKPLLRIQLALAHYMSKSGGRPPVTLSMLVPTYFDTVPNDPATGKPFPYRVEGTRYYLGALKSGNTDQPAGLKGASGPDAKADALSDQDKEALFSVLQEAEEGKAPSYDPSGKRDPFKPYDLAPKDKSILARTPLETYTLDKLTYSAFLQSDVPKAILQSDDGKGFTVQKGSKVGVNSGEITDIFPDKIVIVETSMDFTGVARTRTVELYIGVKNSVGKQK